MGAHRRAGADVGRDGHRERRGQTRLVAQAIDLVVHVPKTQPIAREHFGGVELVNKNWENLYNYLKGRSEGRIAPGHLYPLGQADAPPPPEGWNKPKS